MEEHGTAYYMLEKLKQAFDPKGIMNFGTIYPQEGGSEIPEITSCRASGSETPRVRQ
jgi:hypothetical protein